MHPRIELLLALRHFKRSGEFKDLKETTVRRWVKRFKSELSLLGTASSSADITDLNEKKRGRPLLVGEDVESYVKQFLFGVRRPFHTQSALEVD